MTRTQRRHWRSVIGALVVLALAATVTTCGPRSKPGNATRPTTPPTSGNDIVAQARKEVADAATVPTGWAGPNAAVRAPNGIKVLGIVPCGPYGGCVLNAQGAQQAASALGWKTKTIVPTSASPQQVNAVFRRLIDSRVDAIVWVGFSRTILKPSLDMARAAHIPMVSSQVADGDALDISYGQANAPMEKLGEQVAWWMIADSAGNAKVAVLSDDEFLAGVAIDKGLTRVLGRCSGCRILATKDVTVDRQSTAAAGETTALLQRYPDTKYVFCPFNSRPPFIIQGARAAQRPDVKVGTTKSDSAVLASMKASNEPRLDVTSSVPELWMGWAMVDQLLRVMAKRPLVDHPMPIMLRTPDNVDAPFFQPLSTSDAIDFKSHFKSLWGVK